MKPRALPPPPPKGRKRTPLERRIAALEATKAKFGPKRFSFRHDRDCGRLIGFHLVQLKRPGFSAMLAKAGKYTNAAGAKAALERVGFPSLPAMMDAHFERIPFARALVGDIVQLDAGDGAFADLGAMSIYMGSNTVLGYHEDAQRPVSLLVLEQPLGVWRVLE